MRVKALKTFDVPGKPRFEQGVEYSLPDELALTLQKRGMVEPVAQATKAKAEKPKSTKTKK